MKCLGYLEKKNASSFITIITILNVPSLLFFYPNYFSKLSENLDLKKITILVSVAFNEPPIDRFKLSILINVCQS